MKEIFHAEMRRFMHPALGLAALHLLVLGSLQSTMGLLQANQQIFQFMLLVYLGMGVAAGLYQASTLAAPSRWLWLMHRPLAPQSIFAAHALAAFCLSMLCAGLPWLLFLLGLSQFTSNLLDWRFAGTSLFACLWFYTAWLHGLLLILGRRWAAMLLLLLPLLAIDMQGPALPMLTAISVYLALLLTVATASFRTARHQAGVGVQLASHALLLSCASYFVLLGATSFLYQYKEILIGRHFVRAESGPADSFVNASFLNRNGSQFMQALAKLDDPRGTAWASAKQRHVAILRANFHRKALLHSLSNRGGDNQLLADSNNEWNFSHDAMRYLVRDERSGKRLAWVGPAGEASTASFDSIPMEFDLRRYNSERDEDNEGPISTNFGFILLPHAAYRIDSERRALRQLIVAAPDERFVDFPSLIGNELAALTDKALNVYAPFSKATGPLFTLRASVPLQQALDMDGTVFTAAVQDGTLVSIVYGSKTLKHQMILIHADGSRQQLFERRLSAPPPPSLDGQNAWWISPLMHTLTVAMRGSVDGNFTAYERIKMQIMPTPLSQRAALLCMSLAMLGAWWWLRSVVASRAYKLAWIAACFALGLPGLCALLLLQSRPRRVKTASPAVAPLAAA